MNHYIVTRLGVGISRKSFYDHHIKLLKEGLAVCFSKQTDSRFVWILIVDAKIPDSSFDELRNLIRSANGRVMKYDPIKNMRMLPRTAKEIVGDIDSPYLMTRIDDDDIVTNDFVATLRSEAEKFTKHHSSIALADGVNCHLEHGCYTPYYHPTTPVGVSVYSLSGKDINVYAGNHNKMHERTNLRGGDVKIVRTNEPVWAYIRWGGSDSAAYRGSSKPSNGRPLSELRDDFLYKCGLSHDWFEKISGIHDADSDFRPEIVGTKKARLALKNEYLNILSGLDENDDRYSDKAEALTAAFYAI